MGQGFVELGVDVAGFWIGDDDVELLLEVFDHGRGDAAEGQDSFFHRFWLLFGLDTKHANIFVLGCLGGLWADHVLGVFGCISVASGAAAGGFALTATHFFTSA
ncbi:hypothetical protein D3C81_1779840 [compost metagenome]